MTNASVCCPLATSLPHSWGEHSKSGSQPPYIRAYKLGRKRLSYNQVELVLGEADGGARTAAVQQVVHAEGTRFQEAHQESAVGFHVKLESGAKLQARIFLCYDKHASCSGGSSGCGVAAAAGSEHHAWNLVTRKDCCKGCDGQVLRCMQRFVRQTKRCRNGDLKPAAASAGDSVSGSAAAAPVSSTKDPKFMYLSLDEACTHVDASAFRLVAGIYNGRGSCLLATSVSPRIRVLANNDVPTGAAHFRLEAHLPANWEGWAPQAPQLTSAEPLATSRPPKQAARLKPDALLQPGTKRQALQRQQPQFSELRSLDEWQLLASSPASKLPRPARSREASRHLVCNGGSLHAAAAYVNVADYSHADAASTALTSLRIGNLTQGAPRGCPEPPIYWLAPKGLAELVNEPVAWTAVEPAAPHSAALLNDGGSALAAYWEQEVSHLRASLSMQASAALGLPWLRPDCLLASAAVSVHASALAVVTRPASCALSSLAASFMMPQWQPTSHCATPATETLLIDSFGMPGGSHCDFATDQDLETGLLTMLPSQDALSTIDISYLDMDMFPSFPGDLSAGP